MANAVTGIWADGGEREQQLRKLFAKKHSASEIAAKLGDDVTRSAVLGKMMRLGLVRGDGPRHPRLADQKKQPTAPKVVDDVIPRHLGLIDLEADDCRYPYGDGPFTFCGHPAVEGKPFCPTHCRISYLPPKERNRVGYIELGKSHGGVFGKGG